MVTAPDGFRQSGELNNMMTLADYIWTRKRSDTPRGDFIEDAKSVIAAGDFPKSFDDLLHFQTWMLSSGGCPLAVTAGTQVWREYEKYKQTNWADKTPRRRAPWQA
jgi:hypothetical protein